MKKLTVAMVFVCMVALIGCASLAQEKAASPLWQAGNVRDKIVVCSDIHLGIEDAYSETVGNRRYFVEFLERLATTTDVRELVIDGDFLDEWYLPLSYVETDRAEFYKAVIENNPRVFEAIGDVIASGIKVVYVVGNHDMSVDAGMIRALVPGLVVETDRPGVGVYITGDRNEIAIEHGHRYDVYSAPDTITNKAITKGQTLFPTGYFYARYAADWVISGKPSFVADIPVITDVPDKKTNEDQFFAYAYYRTLATEFSRITLGNKFGDKIFNIRIDGYDGTYSVQDMFPVLNDKGEISAPMLFPNYQRTWDARQDANGVKVKTNFGEAVMGALGGGYFEKQARMQYSVDKAGSETEVVVFGHTHIPEFHEYGGNRYYINTGTWIDHNTNYKDKDGSLLSRTFAVITTGTSDTVDIYQYREDGSLRDMKEQFLADGMK